MAVASSSSVHFPPLNVAAHRSLHFSDQFYPTTSSRTLKNGRWWYRWPIRCSRSRSTSLFRSHYLLPILVIRHSLIGRLHRRCTLGSFQDHLLGFIRRLDWPCHLDHQRRAGCNRERERFRCFCRRFDRYRSGYRRFQIKHISPHRRTIYQDKVIRHHHKVWRTCHRRSRYDVSPLQPLFLLCHKFEYQDFENLHVFLPFHQHRRPRRSSRHDLCREIRRFLVSVYTSHHRFPPLPTRPILWSQPLQTLSSYRIRIRHRPSSLALCCKGQMALESRRDD